ncbi:pentapeptide repeat-containing protein [Moorena producens JHB]|uniref:Pentapeptide repeat-containing protein n=1 Tax=Moorena producens (strain JHB) TaxID=1454205 RepID=A0A1D9FY04_MOOP1|nr:pentapeptide repeat-containing protein [Moorena producens]AOY80249.1 pentapeptide repeat-containing protein [Moorena producens JHB]
MKANEVLKRYAEGQRDFRRVNLRGQSFQGQNLSGADFSEADIRGAKFNNANLTGTKFCQAKAGLQKRWAIVLLLVPSIVSGLSGFASLLGGGLVGFMFESNNQVSGCIALVTIIIVYSVILRQGIGSGVASASASVFAIGMATNSAFAIPFGITSFSAFAIGTASSIASSITSAFAIGTASIIASAIAIPIAFVFAFAIPITITIAIAFGLSGGVETAVAIAVALVLVLLGAYLGWRALKGNPRDAWIRTIAIAFAATGGTSFYKADLTDADFTGATLTSTDLRKATLTRTCWQNSIKLDRARPGKTILANTAIRELLVSGNGYNKSYVDANLRGANLRGANLNYANLKCADISKATLEDAHLEWANLTEAQAIGTDFTHAYLTGACLEAWNIDSTTTLTNIDCQYVFLLENPNSQGSRERHPHDPNRVFQPGDFEKLYKKIINTVQILLRNGVNREAFRQAFQKIMADNPAITSDSIQAIEKKGNDVLLTLEVPEATDKGNLERQILAVYEARLEAAKQTALLEAERSHNQDMKEFVRAAFTSNQSSNPILNFTNTAKAKSDMSDNSRNFNIDNLDIDQSQANNPNNFNVFNDNARQVNTNNFRSEQKQSLAEAAAEIQQLLNQLSQTNPTTTNKDKMIVVGEVIDQIETNPTLKAKVINALKAGGVEAFKEAIDHPLVNILMATIDGWT